jgi:methanethiol S-methyltransferase
MTGHDVQRVLRWTTKMLADPRVAGLLRLLMAALRPPAGVGRIMMAIVFGITCHLIFAAAVMAMIAAMFFGLSESLGRVPWPWALLANAALVLQFPTVHSLLLTGRGGRFLAKLVPGPHGQTLSTTTYALIA